MSVFVIILMLNIRHIFYGISLLPRFKELNGIKAEFSIFALSDETYSMFAGVKVPDGISKVDFYFYVAILNYFYWIIGSLMGSILGGMVNVNFNGIDFMLTALFFVIFLGQWTEADNHFPATIGIVASIIGYVVFKDMFILPTMLFIIGALYLYWRRYEQN